MHWTETRARELYAIGFRADIVQPCLIGSGTWCLVVADGAPIMLDDVNATRPYRVVTETTGTCVAVHDIIRHLKTIDCRRQYSANKRLANEHRKHSLLGAIVDKTQPTEEQENAV